MAHSAEREAGRVLWCPLLHLLPISLRFSLILRPGGPCLRWHCRVGGLRPGGDEPGGSEGALTPELGDLGTVGVAPGDSALRPSCLLFGAHAAKIVRIHEEFVKSTMAPKQWVSGHMAWSSG